MALSFLPSSGEETPEANVLIVNPKQTNAGDFDKSALKYTKNQIRNERHKLENGDTFRIDNVNSELEVLKINPSPGKIVEDTEIKIRNDIIYEPGYDKFEIPDNQMLEVAEKPDLEEKTEVVDPQQFAMLIDSTAAAIEVYKPDDLYTVGEYYFEFDNS